MKILFLLLAFTSFCFADSIRCSSEASAQERFAAKEIRRYVYLRTGVLLPIVDLQSIEKKSDPSSKTIALSLDSKLASEEYRLSSSENLLTISGGSPVAVLYGAYAFAEKLGVRFYLHGDVIPDQRVAFSLPKLSETRKPIFSIRGIQPFHDFPDGPDWWNLDDYLAYIGQLAKMKMNFIGLHCYPHRYDNLPHCGKTMIGPEPLVWIGLPQDINPDGTVKASYPSWWDNSIRRAGWPYAALKTSDYTGGAAQLFPTDDYGPDVHSGLTPIPNTPEQCNELFNRVGRQMGQVFSAAKKLGVKTAIGTETPMTLPPALAEHLKQLGKDPADPKIVAELYEGMFRRIEAVMPADYYWLWTPEGWNSGNFPRTQADIAAAAGALKKIGSHMQLATCGWELGPAFNRAALDEFLPKDCPMSCIHSNFGHAGIVPAFADIKGRPLWTIPWMENDVNLIGYEPWTGRIRYDAADAKRLGCTGFAGIHWHVKSLMNNFATLAQACWDQSYVPESFHAALPPGVKISASGGMTSVYPDSVAVENTTTPAIYRSFRYGMKGYALSIPNGKYSVTLKMCEPRYAEPGKRIFGISLQGKPIVEKLDLFSAAGAINKAFDLKQDGVTVSDGTLKIDFQSVVENPCLCALEVQSADPASPISFKINCAGPTVGDWLSENSGPQRGAVNRTMPTLDYYTDFARAEFGESIAGQAGKIFASMDGEGFLPDMSGWSPVAGAQGCLLTDSRLHAHAESKGRIVESFAALRPKVAGPGNLDRFDWWLSTLRASVAMYEAGAIRGDLKSTIIALHAEKDPQERKNLAQKALSQRIAQTAAWDKVIHFEILTADTPGGLGTLSNLERNSRMDARWLTAWDKEIADTTGAPLPASCSPSTTWDGPAMLRVFSVRTSVKKDEALNLRLAALDKQPVKSVTLRWRPLGSGKWSSQSATHLARAIWEFRFPKATEDFEYFIETKTSQGQTLHWPLTAPSISQTVVVE